jgi:hypothetical protein
MRSKTSSPDRCVRWIAITLVEGDPTARPPSRNPLALTLQLERAQRWGTIVVEPRARIDRIKDVIAASVIAITLVEGDPTARPVGIERANHFRTVSVRWMAN